MKKGEKLEPELDRTLSDRQLEAYSEIATATIEKLRQPGTFTSEGVSLDAEGNSVDMWSEQSVQSDVLGWLIKAAALTLNDTSERRALSIIATVHIGKRARALTGRSIIDINDSDGCEAIIAILKKTADSFREELKSNAVRTSTNRMQATQSLLRWRAGV
jgi:hypothetical protein